MSFNKKIFINDNTPAIDANFLNNLQEEVIRVAGEADSPKASITAITETVRALYGLSTADANVDKALQKVYPKVYNIVTITSSQNWSVPVTGKYDIFICGGGGGGSYRKDDYNDKGGGGGGGYCAFLPQLSLSLGQQISCVVGAGGAAGITESTGDSASGKNGGYTSFDTIRVEGGKGSVAGVGGDGTGGGGAMGYAYYSNPLYAVKPGRGITAQSARVGETFSTTVGQGFGSAKPHVGFCPINGLCYASGGAGMSTDVTPNPAIDESAAGSYQSAPSNRGGGGGGGAGYGNIRPAGNGGSGVIVVGYWA